MYDELIKRLRTATTLPVMNALCQEAADAIEDLIAALTASNEVIAKNKPRWIPVTERLPEVRVWVLCYCRANSFDVFRMTDEGHWQYGNRSIYMKGYVTHWMPLPEPPEEE